MPVIPCLVKKKKPTQIILALLHLLVLIIQLQDPSLPNLYNDLTLPPTQGQDFSVSLLAETPFLLDNVTGLHGISPGSSSNTAFQGSSPFISVSLALLFPQNN